MDEAQQKKLLFYKAYHITAKHQHTTLKEYHILIPNGTLFIAIQTLPPIVH